MTSPSESPPASDGLAAALAPALGAPVEITGLRRLTGGASRETWSFTANGEELILRRDPPGRPSAPGVMRREADAMRACRRAGLRVPEVLVDDDGTLLGTTGLVMRRVPGRDDRPSHPPRRRVRRGPRACSWATSARFLAGLHAIDPAEVPGVEAPDPVGPIWEKYRRLDDRSATFEAVHDWLVAHRPPHTADALIHGDLRMGNVIVGPTGLEAVIDWELVHRGDPLEDLAWLCLKAWRFGAAARGRRARNRSTSSSPPTRRPAVGPSTARALHWWLVAKTLTWGIGCMLQADYPPVGPGPLGGAGRPSAAASPNRSGTSSSCSRPTRAAPRSAHRPPALRPDDATSYGRPTARELLDAVREFLTDEVMAERRPPARVPGPRRRATRSPSSSVSWPRSTSTTRGDDWSTLALAVRDRLMVANPKHLEHPVAASE